MSMNPRTSPTPKNYQAMLEKRPNGRPDPPPAKPYRKDPHELGILASGDVVKIGVGFCGELLGAVALGPKRALLALERLAASCHQIGVTDQEILEALGLTGNITTPKPPRRCLDCSVVITPNAKRCKPCAETYHRNYAREQYRAKHPPPKPIRCQTCHERFTPSNQGPKVTSCPECRRKQHAERNRERQVAKHAGAPIRRRCVNCGGEIAKLGKGNWKWCDECRRSRLKEVNP